jgi:hypothetical protein
MDPPDSQLSGVVTTPSRECSVRGCKSPIAPDATTKMCEACRERHRVYATTKRARRKMEKAYMTAQLGGDPVNDHTNGTSPPHWGTPSNPVVSGSTQLTTWVDMAINPSLSPGHSAGPYPPPAVHQPLTGPPSTLAHPSSLSSELAGALAPLPASSTHQPQPQASTKPQESPLAAEGTSDNDQEDEILRTLQLQYPDPVATAPVPPTPDPSVVDLQSQTDASIPPNEPLKYCTVKGCKAQIPGT